MALSENKRIALSDKGGFWLVFIMSLRRCDSVSFVDLNFL